MFVCSKKPRAQKVTSPQILNGEIVTTLKSIKAIGIMPLIHGGYKLKTGIFTCKHKSSWENPSCFYSDFSVFRQRKTNLKGLLGLKLLARQIKKCLHALF